MTADLFFVNLIAPAILLVLGAAAKWYFDTMEVRRDKKEQERSEAMSKPLNDKLDALADNVQSLKEDIQYVDLQQTKNYVVTTLARIERGEYLSETEEERFVEQYNHYINHGGNSYVKTKHDALKEQGKIL